MDKEARASGLRWRQIAASEVLWAAWNGEYAAFHRPSGKTHFFNETGARLIREVLIEPGTVTDAARALAGCSDDETCDDAFFDHVAALMNRLDQIGFIEPA